MKVGYLQVGGVVVDPNLLGDKRLDEFFEPDLEGPYWEFQFSDKSALFVSGSEVAVLIEDAIEGGDLQVVSGKEKEPKRVLRMPKSKVTKIEEKEEPVE